ncbi:hypothetical protein HMPREF0023_2263 [Acinetobacter sp. ATCC 27244]|uniref:Uncharacterized protein n=4 Tax=Moraxellaceae TaxID=468 RepID=A0A1L6KPP0_ACIHA|nr:hypothetical protein AHTJS_12095 [Acinetobacter haemolyticus]EEH68199.1 hypothetical protein HMPREF0023_2263 [Acinetobacter sp. ATCC 27244]NAR65514.1 hypothetical protein [Acinetobacter haemolyticus]NAR82844.1 hypothetical protein [Acinetobacter haemolyticus]QHI11768.1 hypothetical protein AhaeAN59_12495 [Acinetobacter haemolyticus]
MVVWADFAFAQDCISLKKIEESRVETIEKAHQIESGSWFKEYIWDKSKFSAAYTYGSKRSFEDPNGKTWKDNSEHKGEMKLIYEIPLNIRYQNQKKLLTNDRLRQAALHKTQLDSDNAILEWRIANSMLERKKLDLLDRKDKLSFNEKKIAELEIEEAKYRVDKLVNQIKSLNGIFSKADLCI